MKTIKLIRLTGIAIIVSLLLAILPAAAALAANTITMSKTSAAIGESVTIEGTDFTPSTDTNARLANIYFAKDQANTFTAISSVDTRELVSGGQIGYENDTDEGEFSTTFVVPSTLDDGTDNEDVIPGTYYIYVTVVSESGGGVEVIYAKATFTVTGGDITISPTTGKVDSTITITGTDYVGSTAIAVQFDNTAIAISSGSTTTDASGTFTSTILVPEAIAGAHIVTVTVGTTTETATFTVTSGIIIAPQAGKAGDTITISGTGFGRRASTTVFFNSLPVVTNPTGIITDTNGTFTATFAVPDSLMTAGIYQVEGDDGTNVGTASFTLNVVQPTQTTTTTTTTTTSTTATTTTTATTPVNTGDITVFTQDKFVIITGTGFTPGAKVTVMVGGVTIKSTTADANGAVSIDQFEMPALPGGNHEIIVTDGTNSDTYAYTVESTAPGIPTAAEPLSGEKIKSPWSFKWQPVTDISLPITYELQIASNQSFATGTVLFDIKDIEVPMYELSELQAADLVQDTPYYYRIRAIDGASNQGTWSVPIGFYVAGSASFPNWAIYTIAGVAGILLFGIGYLVGRRTAFYY